MDDTELLLALIDADLEAMASKMEEIAQYWEQLLYTTGGALALEKCFFVAMDWVCENDEYRPRKMQEMGVLISL